MTFRTTALACLALAALVEPALAQQAEDPMTTAVRDRLGRCALYETTGPVILQAAQAQLAAATKRAEDAEKKVADLEAKAKPVEPPPPAPDQTKP